MKTRDENTNWSALRKLNSLFTGRDRLKFLILLIMMFIGAGLEVIGIGTIPLLIGAAANPARVMSHPTGRLLLETAGWTTSEKIVIYGSLSLIVLFLLKNAYLVFNNYVQLRVIANREVALSQRLFSAYMHAPYEFHLQRNSAELMRNVNAEVRNVSTSVLEPIAALIMNLIMSIGLIAVLLFADAMLTLSAVCVLGVIGGGTIWRLQKKLRIYGKEAQLHRKRFVQAIQEGLGSLKEACLSQREKFFISDLTYRARRNAIAQRYQKMVATSANQFLEAIAVTTLLALAILLVVTGRSLESVLPILVLFAAALVRLKATLAKMASAASMLSFSLVAVHPIYDDITRLERLTPIRRDPRKANRLRFRSAIELRDVSYCYPGTSTEVLKEINLRIERGASVGFVGSTGAGKTTIVDVILGLLPPTRGEVLVDGTNIQEDLRGWWGNIGYVPQTIYLTDDTIRHNIALGEDDSRIDNARLDQAVFAAQLEEFVTSLPKGLDSTVGERGIRISGGQRQRIGLARALYLTPNVLVLDEGTSALDNETERAVISAIRKLQGDCTILMIAHRLSTVRDCDRLFFLRSGMLHGAGTYDSLLAGDSHFRELVV